MLGFVGGQCWGLGGQSWGSYEANVGVSRRPMLGFVGGPCWGL